MTEINIKLKIDQIVQTSKANKGDEWITQQKATYTGSLEGAAFTLTVTASSGETLDRVIGPGEGQIFMANLRQVAPRPVDNKITSDLQNKVNDFKHAVDDLIALRQKRLEFLNERNDRLLRIPVNYGETVIQEEKDIKILGIGDKINEHEDETDIDNDKAVDILDELK